MEIPSSEPLPMTLSSEPVTKPVPRPFSIEALMSDSGPRRTTNVIPWNISPPLHQQMQYNVKDPRDTDSDTSLDMDLAQDLSNRSQKDGESRVLNSFLASSFQKTNFNLINNNNKFNLLFNNFPVNTRTSHLGCTYGSPLNIPLCRYMRYPILPTVASNGCSPIFSQTI